MRPKFLSSVTLASLVFGLFLACSSDDSNGGGSASGGASGAGGEGGAGGACAPVDMNGHAELPLPPDGPSLCPSGACNYQTQEGCGAGQACRPAVNAEAKEVEANCEPAGTGKSGDTCSDSSDCARGYLCVGETATDQRCRRLCCGRDWSACDVGESCIRQLYLPLDASHHQYAADLCFPVNDCDPLDPDSCADPDRECKVVDPTGAVACAPRSSAGLGERCGDDTNGCAQGFTCIGPQGLEPTCRRLCAAEACAEPSCPSDEGTCVHFDRNPPGVGECTLKN